LPLTLPYHILPNQTTPHLAPPYRTILYHTEPHRTIPNQTSPSLAPPGLTRPDLAGPNIAPPGLASPNRTTPNLALTKIKDLCSLFEFYYAKTSEFWTKITDTNISAGIFQNLLNYLQRHLVICHYQSKFERPFIKSRPTSYNS